MTPTSISKRTVSLFTPRSKNTTNSPQTPSPQTTIFARAKVLLRKGTVPDKIVSRTSERSKIESFLGDNLGRVGKGAFLYICGPPGTGKTALMNEIYADYQSCESNKRVEMAFINCMSFERPEEVFERIIGSCGDNCGNVENHLDQIFIKRKHKLYILLLNKLTYLDWSF